MHEEIYTKTRITFIELRQKLQSSIRMLNFEQIIKLSEEILGENNKELSAYKNALEEEKKD